MDATRDFLDSWSDVGGLRIHALRARGASQTLPPVVFVPGLGVAAPTMLPTARLLSVERDVFAVDLPGHGESERPGRPLDIGGYAAVLAAWLATIGVERAVWVGHSFGAQVVVELATERRDVVDRLVLMSLTVDPEARTVPRQLGRLLVDAMREPPALLRELVHDYLKTGLRTMYRNGRFALDQHVEGKLPSIEASTLFVCGACDALVPLRWAGRMAELVPVAELDVVPGAPHAVHWTAPAAVARSIERSLDRPVGAGRAST
jgi:2-hydroxy-6-oxonona-2,4-dienedioate hydrolase